MKLAQRIGSQPVLALLAAVVLVAGLIASTTWALSQREELGAAQDRHAARVDAATAAQRAVPELLSYDAASLDEDLADAKGWLTDGFRKDFTTLQDSLIAPAVKEKGFATTATVARLGVVEADAEAVTFLVFVEQATRRDGAEAEPIATRALVRMEQVDGRWLVGDLQPV